MVIDNWDGFNIEMVYKKGKLMYDGVLREFDTPEIDPYLVKRAHDTFHVAPLSAADFTDSRPHAVIGMVPGKSCPRMPATPITSTWKRTS